MNLVVLHSYHSVLQIFLTVTDLKQFFIALIDFNLFKPNIQNLNQEVCAFFLNDIYNFKIFLKKCCFSAKHV